MSELTNEKNLKLVCDLRSDFHPCQFFLWCNIFICLLLEYFDNSIGRFSSGLSNKKGSAFFKFETLN